MVQKCGFYTDLIKTMLQGRNKCGIIQDFLFVLTEKLLLHFFNLEL